MVKEFSGTGSTTAVTGPNSNSMYRYRSLVGMDLTMACQVSLPCTQVGTGECHPPVGSMADSKNGTDFSE